MSRRLCLFNGVDMLCSEWSFSAVDTGSAFQRFLVVDGTSQRLLTSMSNLMHAPRGEVEY